VHRGVSGPAGMSPGGGCARKAATARGVSWEVTWALITATSPAPVEVTTWAARSIAWAAAHAPATAVAPLGSAAMCSPVPSGCTVGVTPHRGQNRSAGGQPRCDDQRLDRDDGAVVQAYPGQSVIDDVERVDNTPADLHPRGGELFGHVGCRRRGRAQEHRDLGAPLLEHQAWFTAAGPVARIARVSVPDTAGEA